MIYDQHPDTATRGPNILLASRTTWFPFDPKSEDFTWTDVASGLSRTCRFSGQFQDDGVCQAHDIYTVAQHCCLGGDIMLQVFPTAPARLRLAFHLHDGEEALSGFGDPVGPVKHSPMFRDILRPYLDRIQDVIAVKAGLTGDELRSVEVKQFDRLTYCWENRDIRGIAPPDDMVPSIPKEIIKPWTPGVAYARWMNRLVALLGAAHV